MISLLMGISGALAFIDLGALNVQLVKPSLDAIRVLYLLLQHLQRNRHVEEAHADWCRSWRVDDGQSRRVVKVTTARGYGNNVSR